MWIAPLQILNLLRQTKHIGVDSTLYSVHVDTSFDIFLALRTPSELRHVLIELKHYIEWKMRVAARDMIGNSIIIAVHVNYRREINLNAFRSVHNHKLHFIYLMKSLKMLFS